LVARGPSSRAVVQRAMELGARAARGNHDQRLLEARQGKHALKPEIHKLAEELSPLEWRYLEALPLWIDLPDHRARVVHAGVVPGRPIDHTPAEAILTMRALDDRGRWTDDKRAKPLWGERYDGPPHVVFGHNALDEPQLHEWATGIDTACVYGGRLTALVLDADEPVPHGALAVEKLTSVSARRAYHAGYPGALK